MLQEKTLRENGRKGISANHVNCVMGGILWGDRVPCPEIETDRPGGSAEKQGIA